MRGALSLVHLVRDRQGVSRSARAGWCRWTASPRQRQAHQASGKPRPSPGGRARGASSACKCAGRLYLKTKGPRTTPLLREGRESAGESHQLITLRHLYRYCAGIAIPANRRAAGVLQYSLSKLYSLYQQPGRYHHRPVPVPDRVGIAQVPWHCKFAKGAGRVGTATDQFFFARTNQRPIVLIAVCVKPINASAGVVLAGTGLPVQTSVTRNEVTPWRQPHSHILPGSTYHVCARGQRFLPRSALTCSYTHTSTSTSVIGSDRLP